MTQGKTGFSLSSRDLSPVHGRIAPVRACLYCIACAVILFAGFVFRAIDQDVCEAFPLGTHFLWHVLIALMLGVILFAVAKYGASRRPDDRS